MTGAVATAVVLAAGGSRRLGRPKQLLSVGGETLVRRAARAALGCGADLAERTVSDVTLLETSPSALDTDEALDGLATAAPRKILWIERERDVYDPNLVARDLERIERFYRARGYYEAKVRAARVVHIDAHHVRVEVEVMLGEPVIVRRVDPAGIALPWSLYGELRGHAAEAARQARQVREQLAADPVPPSSTAPLSTMPTTRSPGTAAITSIRHEVHRVDALHPQADPALRRYRCQICNLVTKDVLADGVHRLVGQP